MKPEEFTRQATGKLVPTIQGAMAFVPNSLPPKLDMGNLVKKIAQAQKAMGELSGLGRALSNPYLLIRPFMRREAVSSSRIEGTVTTLSQLFLFELGEETHKTPTQGDALEVLNYVRALENALQRLEELPVSIRLIKYCHTILMRGVSPHRGANVIPGELRRDQNWIGARLIENARFVPPPPKESEQALSELEKFINDPDPPIPSLVQLALIHYQFETIHPFPDGNGRVGRLLIPLILCAKKEISQPLLYLSPYFERNYDAYIDHMLTVSQKGSWEDWINFFLTGVEEACKEAIQTLIKLQDLQVDYRKRVQRARASALLSQIIDLLFESPALTVPYVARRLDIAYNAAKNNIKRLVDLNILKNEGHTKPAAFWATEILDILMH